MKKPRLLVIRVVGIIFVALGLIWILQGTNVLPGSYMTGQIAWAYRGGVVVLFGAAILLLAMRRAKKLHQ